MNRFDSGTPVIFGEVLLDRFPDGNVVLGGAPFNVAWNLQALGLTPLLISRIGTDSLGELILSAMRNWSMPTAGIQHDPRHATGTVEVSFNQGEPSYHITASRAWDHITVPDLHLLPSGNILYHGSLALRTERSRQTLEHLKGSTGSPVLLDVNLRPPWWDSGTVFRFLKGARWVKMNKNELAELAPDCSETGHRAEILLHRTGIESLIVTRGADGAVTYRSDGSVHEQGPADAARVVDTVGAGDAFASVVLLGLARGWTWPDLLHRAQSFASAVVGIQGAISTDPGFYGGFRKAWEPA